MSRRILASCQWLGILSADGEQQAFEADDLPLSGLGSNMCDTVLQKQLCVFRAYF
jgi:hypothetical protein